MDTLTPDLDPDSGSDDLVVLPEFEITLDEVALDLANHRWLQSRGDAPERGMSYEIRCPELDGLMGCEYWCTPDQSLGVVLAVSADPELAGVPAPGPRVFRARHLPQHPNRFLGSTDALVWMVDLEQKSRRRRSSGRLADMVVAAATGPLADHPDSLWMLLAGVEGQELWP